MKKLVAAVLAVVLMLTGTVGSAEGWLLEYLNSSKSISTMRDYFSRENGVRVPTGTEFVWEFESLSEAPAGYTPVMTAGDLKLLSEKPAGSYILMADIDAGEWIPEAGSVFTGVLNGNGHTIKYSVGGAIAHEEAFYRGLFDVIDGATVCHLRLDVTIYGGYDDLINKPLCFGGLAARMRGNSSVVNCVSSVDIDITTVEWTGEDSFERVQKAQVDGIDDREENCAAGGLIGVVESGDEATISMCRTIGMINGAKHVGGIVGAVRNNYLIISACQNQADVSGVAEVGGIAGLVEAGNVACSISSCANEGEIFAYDDYAGGIVGVARGGVSSISECLNIGTVTAGAYGASGFAGGGIAGETNGILKRCISLSQVYSRSKGAVCSNYNDNIDVSSLYWLKDDYGWIETPVDNAGEAGNAPLKLSEAGDAAYYPELNFTMMWTVNENMPCPYPSLILKPLQNPHKTWYVNETYAFCMDGDQNGLNWLLLDESTRNYAGRLGETYRDQETLKNLNELWFGLELLKDLPVDISVFERTNVFEMVLSDLVTSNAGVDAFQAQYDVDDLKNVTGVASYVADTVEVAEVPIDLAARAYGHATALKMAISEIDWANLKNFDGLANGTVNMHYQQIRYRAKEGFLTAFDSFEALKKTNAFSKTLGIASSTISVLSSMANYVEDANELGLMLEAYMSATDRYNDVLKATSEKAQMLAEQEWEGMGLFGLLSGNLMAVVNDVTYMFKNNRPMLLKWSIDSMVEQAEDYIENQNTVALMQGAKMGLGISGTVGVNFILPARLGLAKSAAMGAALYIGTFQFGITTFDMLLNCGSVSNCALMIDACGHLADAMQLVVEERYHAFVGNATYENAEAFNNALNVYISLQKLACDYAIKYSEAVEEMKLIDIEGLLYGSKSAQEISLIKTNVEEPLNKLQQAHMQLMLD